MNSSNPSLLEWNLPDKCGFLYDQEAHFGPGGPDPMASDSSYMMTVSEVLNHVTVT
jgi:hypothetical protein